MGIPFQVAQGLDIVVFEILQVQMEGSAAALEQSGQGIEWVSTTPFHRKVQVTHGGSVKEAACDALKILKRVGLRVLTEQALPDFWRAVQGEGTK